MPLARRSHVLLFGAISALSGLLIGADGGLLNIALLYLRQEAGMTDGRMGFLTAAVPAGVMAGALLVGWLSESLGRKKALVLAAALFGLGMTMAAGGGGYPWLLAGRLAQGMALGFCFGVVPVFLSESLDGKSRSVCIVLFQLSTSLGLCLAMALGAWFHGRVEAQLTAAAGQVEALAAIRTQAWRTLLWMASLPAGGLLLAALCSPESPRWLFGRGRLEEARAVLEGGREPGQAEVEFREMAELAEVGAHERAIPGGASLWRRHYILPLLLGLAIFIMNNAVGTGVINTYSSTLLKTAGLGEAAAAGGSVWMTLAALAGIVAGLAAVNHLPRRTLMHWGLGLALVAGAAGVVVSAWGPKWWPPQTVGLATLGCMVAYQIALSFGPATCGWLLVAELFPARVRSHGMGLGILLGSGANIGLMALFLPIVNHWGLAAQWGIWGGLTALYLAFSLFLLPETRGKTLEEVEAMFVKEA